MNIESLQTSCLSIPGAAECLPFDDTTLVYKVMGRMFAYFSLEPRDGEFFITLKCAPDRSIPLRERYEGITAGYHLNKTLWISVYINSDVPDTLIEELIRHSVSEVVKKLPKYKQNEYNNKCV